MTHTLIVAQIAKGISEELGLNTSLTEAIALGHDLGHTPFGHQGEKTLDDILKGKYNIIQGISEGSNLFGGFKHNYQSMRVVNILEESYVEFSGLDLSVQVIEGIWKHTRTCKSNGCENNNCLTCEEASYHLSEFLPLVNEDVLKTSMFPHLKFSTTLEGQVVAIADEIAQRSHDLDDALASGLLNVDELMEILKVNKCKSLLDEVEKMDDLIKTAGRNNRTFYDRNEMLKDRIASAVIKYFIADVVGNSTELISNYPYEDFQNDGYRVTELLLKFSEEGKIVNDYLENIVRNKVINNSEVKLADIKAEKIVLSLFTEFYNNPLLLPKTVLKRINVDLRKFTVEIIDFFNGSAESLDEEFLRYQKVGEENDDVFYKPENTRETYLKKRKILVRAICDYISSMTDSQAIEEYHRIIDC